MYFLWSHLASRQLYSAMLWEGPGDYWLVWRSRLQAALHTVMRWIKFTAEICVQFAMAMWGFFLKAMLRAFLVNGHWRREHCIHNESDILYLRMRGSGQSCRCHGTDPDFQWNLWTLELNGFSLDKESTVFERIPDRGTDVWKTEKNLPFQQMVPSHFQLGCDTVTRTVPCSLTSSYTI